MDIIKDVYIAPDGYTVNDRNPFIVDGSYDRTWSIFIVDESVQGMVFTGKSPNGCYTVSATPSYGFFTEIVTDFLQYETDHGRKVIFVSDGRAHHSIDDAKTHYMDSTVRKSDPRFLVHSTVLSTYEQVLRDGMLKSPNRLSKEGRRIHAIGLAPLGEPDDYLDYVMFAAGGIAPELVVNSRLCRVLNCDPDARYTPQARMYFDCHKMIRDGIIVRDVGRKVYDCVPLDQYLLKTVFSGDLILPDNELHWTPLTFSTEADNFMRNAFADK